AWSIASGTPGLVGRARCTGAVVPANAVSCGPDATAAAALARAAGGRGSSRRQAVRALTSRAIGTAIAGRVIAVYTPPLQVAVGPAGPLLDERVRVAGVRFDETYHPVQVWRRVGGGDDPPAASGFNYGGVAPAATYAVRVEAEDEDAIQRLRRDRQPEIVGVF